jgi:hypothetical protein
MFQSSKNKLPIPQIYKIVYRSYATGKPGKSHSERDIADILGVSKAWNFSQGITGALLLSRSGYAQVLEGPVHAVKSLFGQLSASGGGTTV